VGALVPTAVSDLIYGGDIDNWTSAAKSLKLRYALHLSKRNGYEPVKVILDAGGFIESSAVDMTFTFGTAANEWNPRYQFDSDRGDIRAGKVIVDMMLATSDPRLPLYFDKGTASNYIGVAAGTAGPANSSWVGSGFASQDSPLDLITYAEVKFIEAEVLFQTGDPGGAATAYNAAVKASLAQHGVSSPSWEAANASETAAITLQKIIEGKYVANFLSSEVFVDYRRTGYPVIPLPSNAT
jgi:hypothetical protein